MPHVTSLEHASCDKFRACHMKKCAISPPPISQRLDGRKRYPHLNINNQRYQKISTPEYQRYPHLNINNHTAYLIPINNIDIRTWIPCVGVREYRVLEFVTDEISRESGRTVSSWAKPNGVLPALAAWLRPAAPPEICSSLALSNLCSFWALITCSPPGYGLPPPPRSAAP